MVESTEEVAPVFENEEVIEEVLDDAETLHPTDVDMNYADEQVLNIHGDDQEGGKARAASKKQYFNVIKVENAPMPSENAKYAGSSPSVAAKKAARRIFDKAGTKKFTVFLRKVSQEVVGRTLYKYNMTMLKLPEPTGFFNAVIPKFKPWNGKLQENVEKHIKIVTSSDDPVFGYVASTGEVVLGESDASGQGSLHRNPANNTLTFNIGSAPMPKQIGTHNVTRTDWIPTFERAPLEPSESEEMDIAGLRKKALKEAEMKKLAKQKEKAKAQKSKSKAQSDAHSKAKTSKKSASTKPKAAPRVPKSKSATPSSVPAKKKFVQTKVVGGTLNPGQPLTFRT